MDFRRNDGTTRYTLAFTDPEARLQRKGRGREARLVFLGHVLIENRHSLLMDFTANPATGTVERNAVLEFLNSAWERDSRPLGGDRGYDTQDCVRDIWAREVVLHVAPKKHSAIDGRTTHNVGYKGNLRLCEREEEIVDWMKTEGGLRRIQYRAVACPGLACYSCTLVRMAVNLRHKPQAWLLPPGKPSVGFSYPKGDSTDSTRQHSAFQKHSPPFLHTRNAGVVIQNPFCTVLTR